ncbi:hypothetical protein Bca4012_102932 [Brassica carinata]
MLTLEPFSEDQGRSAVHREDPANQLPYALRVYSPVDSHTSLGGIYRPIGAAFPNNPTRRQRLRGATGSNAAGSHPLWRPFPGTWARSVAEALLGLQFERRRRPIFKLGSSRVIRLTWGRVEDFGSSRAFGRSGSDLARIEFTTACQGAPGILSSDFGQRVRNTGDQLPSDILERIGGGDFTASNKHRLGLAKAGCLVECSLTLFVRGLVISGSYAYNPAKLGGGERITTESVTTMILPQDQPGSIHKSRQALVMFRKHMERGTGEDLAVIFCRRQACLAGQNFLSHRHNLSATEIPANSLFTLANNA